MVCEYGYVSIKFRLVKQLTESESRVLYHLAQNLYTTKKVSTHVSRRGHGQADMDGYFLQVAYTLFFTKHG